MISSKATLGHLLERGQVAQPLDDLAEVREVFLERDVVPLRLKDAPYSPGNSTSVVRSAIASNTRGEITFIITLPS